MKKLGLVLLAIAPALLGQERQVEPTWLHRYAPSLRQQPTDLTSGSCHYTPIFWPEVRASQVEAARGKGLCGPQCSGVLLGRKDLIDAALLNTNPYEGAVCRPMKVGKEEVMGCLAAVETWLKLDSKALYRQWNDRVQRIAKLVDTVPGVKTEVYVPADGNRYPTLRVSWDQQGWGFSAMDCVQKLREGDPVIEVLGPDNPSLVPAVHEGNPNQKERRETGRLELVSMTIQPGEEIIVGRRLRAALSAARNRASKT